MHLFKRQKIIVRAFATLAILFFLSIFVYAYYTEVHLEEVKDYAPFLENSHSKRPVVVHLDKPHRTERELQIWVSRIISESLNLSLQDYDSIIQQNEKYFMRSGYTQYKSYLNGLGLKTVLAKHGYDLNVIVDQTPILQNANAVEGVYRWLYDVPLIVSYVLTKKRTYKPGSDLKTRKITVRVQLRRVESTNNVDDDALKIESWQVLPRKK